MDDSTQPVWPVDLDRVRLWPMESADGPLLQELLDDLADFRSTFGEPGAADAVSTFLALPEGHGYEDKLLLGLWRNGSLAGALDCILGHPSERSWTVGLLVVADRHRGVGIGSSVLDWLEVTAAQRGCSTVRGTVRAANRTGLAFAEGRGYTVGPADATGIHVATKRL